MVGNHSTFFRYTPYLLGQLSPIIELGDGDIDLHTHDWQVNTINGPTKLVRQDAILGGLSIGQFDLQNIIFMNM